MPKIQSACFHHEAHDLRISTNENDIQEGKEDREIMKAKINKWTWILIGFGACASAVISMSGVLVGSLWWMLGNKYVMTAIINARG